MKENGHSPQQKDGRFLGCLHIDEDAHLNERNLLDENYSALWEQNDLIRKALETSGFYNMVVTMMDRFHPLQLKPIYNDGVGCSCGIYGNPITRSDTPDVVIMSTIDSAIGCAEGIVHELGHYKFHTIGINLEDWDQDLIGNEFDEVFNSPVRFDKLRPMGAVMHAEFSYVYVTKFYIKLIKKAKKNGEYLGSTIESLMNRQAYNLKRIGNGIHTIKEHYKPGDEKFYKAFMSLSEKTWNDAFKAFEGCEDDYDWEPVRGKP